MAIGVDCLTVTPENDSENTFLIVLVEYFTKHIRLSQRKSTALILFSISVHLVCLTNYGGTRGPTTCPKLLLDYLNVRR